MRSNKKKPVKLTVRDLEKRLKNIESTLASDFYERTKYLEKQLNDLSVLRRAFNISGHVTGVDLG